MQLIHFLIIIISLSCGSLSSLPIEWTLLQSLIATGGTLAIWWMLTHIGSRTASSQVASGDVEPVSGAMWFERQLTAFQWLSLPFIVLCLVGFGIAKHLDSLPLLSDSMFLQSLILLTPGLLMWTAVVSSEHHYGVRLEYTPRGLKNYFSSIANAFRGGIAWLIVPVVLLLGAIDLLNRLPIAESYVSAITILLVMIAIPVCFPRMVRILFKTSAVDEATNHWLEQITITAGVGKIKSVRWETGGKVFNAMVAGIVKPFRTLLISDRVLDELPKQQIAMVLLHEVAHLRRRHVPIRMLAVLPAWVVGALATKIAGEGSWGMALGSTAGILMTVLMLRIVAYRTEYDADVQACKLAVKIHSTCEGVPPTYDEAADALSAALKRVTAGNPQAQKSTWMHPSVNDRIDAMQKSTLNVCKESSMANHCVA